MTQDLMTIFFFFQNVTLNARICLNGYRKSMRIYFKHNKNQSHESKSKSQHTLFCCMNGTNRKQFRSLITLWYNTVIGLAV